MSDTPADRSRVFRQEVRTRATASGLADMVESGAFDAQIDSCRAEFVEKFSDKAQDAASTGIVAHVGEVLGCWQVLCRNGLSEEAVRALLVTALSTWVRDNAEAYSEARLGIRRDQPEKAFESAKANFKTRGEQRFGRHFRYQTDVADENRAHFGITRCLFNDLLRSAGYPQVIPVFCALDIVWAEDVTHPRYDLSFSRPTTLATGDDYCRFQFDRVHKSVTG